jgi:ATP-dependent helicase HrpB
LMLILNFRPRVKSNLNSRPASPAPVQKNLPELFAELPVSRQALQILAAASQAQNLLLISPTGTGKSTALPYLLHQDKQRILVLQPRRIAARTLSQWVSQVTKTALGDFVGYKYRFSNCSSEQTQILYQTYGNFLEESLNTPSFDKYNWILFDEFHERTQDMDILLSLFLDHQKSKATHTRLAILSADIQIDKLTQSLDTKPLVLSHPGFPVEIRYRKPSGPSSLVKDVMASLSSFVRGHLSGKILVFLPGKTEISQCLEQCLQDPLYKDTLYYPLHAAISESEQQKVFNLYPNQTCIVFCTNIAETSLTVPDVVVVIDSGLENRSEWDSATQNFCLRQKPISTQNALQRKGRAGRTQNGICIRLWDQTQESQMPAAIQPELISQPPDRALLILAALAKSQFKISQWGFIDRPTTASLEKSLKTLLELGFLNQSQQITNPGRKALNAGCQSLKLAWLIQQATQDSQQKVLAAMIALLESELNPKTECDLEAAAKNLISGHHHYHHDVAKIFNRIFESKHSAPVKNEDYVWARQKIIEAFSDRIALQTESGTYKLPDNRILIQESAPISQYICALQLFSSETGRTRKTRNSWYLALSNQEAMAFLNKTEQNLAFIWDKKKKLFKLLLVQKQKGLADQSQEISGTQARTQFKDFNERLAQEWRQVLTREPEIQNTWCDPDTKALLNKIRWTCTAYPEYGYHFGDSDLDLIETVFFESAFNLSDLKPQNFRRALTDYMGPAFMSWMNPLFPAEILLVSGRKAKMDYCGEQPELQARVADLLGTYGELRIAGEKLAVCFNILSPARRSVQKTWNLTDFWKTGYPLVRKELRGRYPKHPWPENPFET